MQISPTVARVLSVSGKKRKREKLLSLKSPFPNPLRKARYIAALVRFKFIQVFLFIQVHGLWRDKANKDDGDDTDEPPTSPFSPHGNEYMTYPLFSRRQILLGIYIETSLPVRVRHQICVSPMYVAIHHDINFLGGDLAGLGRPHGIGCENNKQTKLTVEPSPKTKELRPIGVQLK